MLAAEDMSDLPVALLTASLISVENVENVCSLILLSFSTPQCDGNIWVDLCKLFQLESSFATRVFDLNIKLLNIRRRHQLHWTGHLTATVRTVQLLLFSARSGIGNVACCSFSTDATENHESSAKSLVVRLGRLRRLFGFGTLGVR